MRKFIIKIEIFAWTMTMGRYEHVDLIIRWFVSGYFEFRIKRFWLVLDTRLDFSVTSGRVRVQLGSGQTHIFVCNFRVRSFFQILG